VVSVAPGVAVFEASAFVETAASVAFGADCACEGVAELFWGAAAVVIVSAISAAIEIAG